MPEEFYTFTQWTFNNLESGSILWPLPTSCTTEPLCGATSVPRSRSPGRDRDGTWLAVALVKEDHDEYTVTSARYLDSDEIAAISRLRGEQR